jgi:hypothetical protein
MRCVGGAVAAEARASGCPPAVLPSLRSLPPHAPIAWFTRAEVTHSILPLPLSPFRPSPCGRWVAPRPVSMCVGGCCPPPLACPPLPRRHGPPAEHTHLHDGRGDGTHTVVFRSIFRSGITLSLCSPQAGVRRWGGAGWWEEQPQWEDREAAESLRKPTPQLRTETHAQTSDTSHTHSDITYKHTHTR